MNIGFKSNLKRNVSFGTNQQVNQISLGAENNNNNEPSMERIAIFNNTLIEYLCDTGCAKTTISWSMFLKIVKEAPDTVLEPYSGLDMRSANSKLVIKGIVQLKRCVMAVDCVLINPIVFVAESLNFPCLLGRNWIMDITKLKPIFKQMGETVKEMTESIIHNIQRFPKLVIDQGQ
jgi:hypothetical protein